MALEFFAKQMQFGDWKVDNKSKSHVASGMIGKTAVVLVAPDTFMNKSGAAVLKFVKSQKAAERMVVIYDDLDLPLGGLKLSFNRGSGGHRGVESIMKAVKTKKFTRRRRCRQVHSFEVLLQRRIRLRRKAVGNGRDEESLQESSWCARSDRRRRAPDSDEPIQLTRFFRCD